MSNLLKHRGYYGSIEASPEDNCLFGRLQFIRALVSYEGETVAELKEAFEQAVDDYLDTCASLGQERGTLQGLVQRSHRARPASGRQRCGKPAEHYAERPDPPRAGRVSGASPIALRQLPRRRLVVAVSRDTQRIRYPPAPHCLPHNDPRPRIMPFPDPKEWRDAHRSVWLHLDTCRSRSAGRWAVTHC